MDSSMEVSGPECQVFLADQGGDLDLEFWDYTTDEAEGDPPGHADLEYQSSLQDRFEQTRKG